MPPLFACLRSSRATSAIVDVARDFSPRLQRQGPACVVFDVSGLGRLLGDPTSIGEELARSAAAHDGPIGVALAPTMTAAMLLTLVDVPLVDDDIRCRTSRSFTCSNSLWTWGTTVRRNASSTASRKEAAPAKLAFDIARRWGLTLSASWRRSIPSCQRAWGRTACGFGSSRGAGSRAARA